jgi:hypothetical protein
MRARRKKLLTDEEIEAGRSAKGGWTRQQLAAWGVSWPPPKGWRVALTGRPPEDEVPLRPGREEQIAIAKARKMLSRKPPNHPDRVKLEEFLRRRHWCQP